jgi:flagellar biosynthesis/type III secretory pathway chaperone
LEQYADQFIGTLNRYIDTYQQLVTLAKAKTQILVAGDIKGLDSLLMQETELLLAAKKLESQKNKLVQTWGQDEKWTSDDITLEFIIIQLSPAYKAEVEKSTVQLKSLIQELQGINKTNGELIEQALQFVNYTLEVMTSANTGGATYGSDGHMGGKQAFKVLDQKA